MSMIRRSLQSVTGDITVIEGDIIVTDPTKGIVMQDNVGDTNRVQPYDDAGVKTIEVTEIP